MSTQTADFPDFFRGDQWQNPAPFISEHLVSHGPATAVSPVFSVMGWEGIAIVVGSGDYVFGTATWYADAAGLFALGTQQFVTMPFVSYFDILPVCGPFVSFSITYTSGPGSVTTNTYISPVKGAEPWRKPCGDYGVFQVTALAMAGNTTVTLNPHFVTSGRATLAGFVTGPNWSAQVYPIDRTGARNGLAGLVGVIGSSTHTTVELTLPAAPVQMFLRNDDAAAQTAWCSLILSR